MNTTQYIRYFAIANLILGIMSIVASFLLESYLHPLLQEFLQEEAIREPTAFEDILFIIVIPIIIIHLVSLFGLIFVKSWSKNVFLLSLFTLFVFSFFIGPYVEHAITSVIDGLSALVAGLIVALLLFTQSDFS